MNPSFCRHLRNKKMFIPAPSDDIAADDRVSPGDNDHCWCNRTLTEVGLDDQPVGRTLCQPGRQCYQE
jgi:hypothetical protein